MKRIIAALLAAVTAGSLASCSFRNADPYATDVTTESDRVTTEEITAAASTAAPTDTAVETEPAVDSETAEQKPSVIPTGSVSYPTDFSFLDSVPAGHFSDKNPDDENGCWYPAPSSRDPLTGEVTHAWERSEDTLELIDRYGAIYRGDEEKKVVYLTFDCGYEYRTEGGAYDDGVTNAILDTLKEKNAPGTFFVTGDYLTSDIEIVQRMLDEGHIVGNHTMHHYNMTTVTPEVFVSEIKEANDLLKSKIPTAPDMVFYRPPEGGANQRTLALAHEMGLVTTFWSATETDYNTNNQPDPTTTLESNKRKLHEGCVYLLHAVSTTNAQILGDLIDYIRAEGFEIAPLSAARSNK